MAIVIDGYMLAEAYAQGYVRSRVLYFCNGVRVDVEDFVGGCIHLVTHVAREVCATGQSCE